MKHKILFSLSMLFCLGAIAQPGESNRPDANAIALATEFSIPTAAAFTLLGNTPAAVTSPGFTKDVKLDYFLDGKSLKPNIAFQFQPVWLLGFQNISLDEYRNINPITRALSRVSISIGTVQDNDSVSRLAYAGRITFEKDPMMDLKYTEGISSINDRLVEQRELEARPLSKEGAMHRRKLRRLRDEQAKLNSEGSNNVARLEVIADSIQYHENNLASLQSEIDKQDIIYNEIGTKSVDSFVKAYIERNWARPKMDIGFGAVNRYTSGASITDLGLAKNGYGVWINPSAGILLSGPGNTDRVAQSVNILFTGLFRYTQMNNDREVFYGGNIRLGGAKLNLFTEYTRQYLDRTITQAVAYGGAYRIGNKKLLQFGLRTNYNENFSFKSLQPVIAIDWELGKDVIQKLAKREAL